MPKHDNEYNMFDEAAMSYGFTPEENQQMLLEMKADQRERDIDQMARWFDEYGLGPVNHYLSFYGFKVRRIPVEQDKD
jgi:hypothetical protein